MTSSNFTRTICVFVLINLISIKQNFVFGQNHIVPISASTTAGQFSPSTGIEYIYDQATGVSDPLTDSYTSTCFVGTTQGYISSYGVTLGTITVGIPTSTIDALHIWNGWSSSCELNHSLNNVTMSFYSGGILIGSEVVTIPIPDGSGFGFVVPFGSIYSDVDEVVMVVNSLHGGNEIGIIELGFHPIIIDCDDLTTSVSDTEICFGEEVTLEATSINGGTISWDGGVVNGVSFAPPVGTTAFTATSDNPDDCDFSVDITVHELPTIIANAIPTEICLGETVTFVGTGGVSYVWDMGVVNLVPFEPLTIGSETYTITGTDAFGCVNTDEIDVLVGAPPTADFEFIINGSSSEDGLIGGCIESLIEFNDLSTIIAPGVITTWNWNFGDGTTSTSENPTHTYGAAGTYTITLTVTSDVGCSDTYTLNIIMTEGLSLDVLYNEPSCYGFSDGSLTINVIGAGGDLIFEITDSEGNIINEDNSNTANTLNSGWYYFTVSDGSDCDGTDSIFIDQPQELAIDLTLFNPLCFGDETGWARVDSVYNASGDYSNISFIWNPNPSGVGGVDADSSFNMGADNYTLTINDDNGCSKVVDFVITEPTELVFSEFGFDPAYCRLHEYQSGNGVVFGAATGGTADYNYLWTNLDNGDTKINTTWGGLNPGNYQLTVTDANGCILTETLVLDSLNPIAAFTINSDQLNGDYQGTAPVEVSFTNNSENFANPNNPDADPVFFWNLDKPAAAWEISHDYFEVFDTTYLARGQTYTVDVCLVALNKNGCTDTACKTITIYEPTVFENINIFTPNGDGKNDNFTFSFKTASIAEFKCVIVNRWGIVVYQINDINDGWDGTDRNGDPCPDGVYFYTYSATTDNNMKLEGQGTVQITGSK